MYKILKCILGVVIITMLIFSVFYMLSDHEYDLVKIEDVKTDEEYANIIYEKEEEIEDDSVLGILIIDKINLKGTVKEGSTESTLKEYIGHITETAKYDGNIGLAAHNRANKYSYFARINELENGDKIVYKTKFYEREYVVIKKSVIYDTDWSYLKLTDDNRLTLITCIKDKHNQRLCVQAIETKNKE